MDNKIKVKSKFVGLDSRKERRLAAKKDKVEFSPQYNGDTPVRTKNKAEIKIIKNDYKRENKIAQKGVTN